MRLTGSKSIGLLLGAALFALPCTALAFDIDYQASPQVLKHFKIEKPEAGQDQGDHVASYLRLIPVKGNREYPAFITTHNYLTCPDDKEKKWYLYEVGQVDYHKRSGIKILGFFFEKPTCDNPTFHLDAVFPD